MSSIDWQRLVDEHDRAPERDDDAWLEALAMMDEDPVERELAEQADPLLMFRRLPEPTVTASDIDSMKAAVMNLRQVSETLAENPPESRRRRLARRGLPFAAALAVAMTLALLGGPGAVQTPGTPQAVATVASAEIPAAAASTSRFVSAGLRAAPSVDFALDTVNIDGAAVAASFAASELPLIEDADPGADLLMQIENDDMSLVVVLAPGMDV